MRRDRRAGSRAIGLKSGFTVRNSQTTSMLRRHSASDRPEDRPARSQATLSPWLRHAESLPGQINSANEGHPRTESSHMLIIYLIRCLETWLWVRSPGA
jgi:hypothetical protein